MTDLSSPEAEARLLSLCCLNARHIAESIEEGIRAKHFSDHRNAHLYEEVLNAFTEHGKLEVEVLASELRKSGRMESIGWEHFLHVTGELVSTESVKYWAQEIKDRHYRRELQQIIQKAAPCLEDLTLSPQSIAAGLSNRSLDVINEQEKPITLGTACDEAEALIARIQAGEATEEELGIPTPIQSINRFLGAPRPGELIVIAARPGGGKSSMMRGLIRHVAEHFGRAMMFSREMPIGELVTIFGQEKSGVSWRNIRDNSTPQDKVQQYLSGLRKIKGMSSRLIINDRDRTLDQIAARIAAAARSEDPLFAVAVDYLQRYDPQQQKGETRDIAIGRFTLAMKDAALSYKVPVFLGAQIGRGSERENRTPRLSDLRESGNIEQDADRVWFLWIPDKTPDGMDNNPDNKDVKTIYVQLVQAKGRGDGRGTIDLAFHRDVTTFREWV